MANNTKSKKRHQRAQKTRIIIGNKNRICVFKTSRHIYAQLIIKDENGNSFVKCASSTLDKNLFPNRVNANKQTAQIIGKDIAQKCKQQSITQIAFDRCGFLYHGIIQAIADSARKEGLKF